MSSLHPSSSSHRLLLHKSLLRYLRTTFPAHPKWAHMASTILHYGITYLRALSIGFRRNILLSPTKIAAEEAHTWGHTYKVKSLFAIAATLFAIRKIAASFTHLFSSFLAKASAWITLLCALVVLYRFVYRFYCWLNRYPPITVSNTTNMSHIKDLFSKTCCEPNRLWNDFLTHIHIGHNIVLIGGESTTCAFLQDYVAQTHKSIEQPNVQYKSGMMREVYEVSSQLSMLDTSKKKIDFLESILADLYGTAKTALLVLRIDDIIPEKICKDTHILTKDAPNIQRVKEAEREGDDNEAHTAALIQNPHLRLSTLPPRHERKYVRHTTANAMNIIDWLKLKIDSSLDTTQQKKLPTILLTGDPDSVERLYAIDTSKALVDRCAQLVLNTPKYTPKEVKKSEAQTAKCTGVRTRILYILQFIYEAILRNPTNVSAVTNQALHNCHAYLRELQNSSAITQERLNELLQNVLAMQRTYEQHIQNQLRLK